MGNGPGFFTRISEQSRKAIAHNRSCDRAQAWSVDDDLSPGAPRLHTFRGENFFGGCVWRNGWDSRGWNTGPAAFYGVSPGWDSV